jgi:hypothetical protein
VYSQKRYCYPRHEGNNLYNIALAPHVVVPPLGHLSFGCYVQTATPVHSIMFVSMSVLINYKDTALGVPLGLQTYRSEIWSWANGHWIEGPIFGQP